MSVSVKGITNLEKSTEDIVNEHTEFLRPFCLQPKPDQARLPYLYWIPKLHKAGKRFIAGSSGCTTTRASQAVCAVLHTVLDSLRKRDDIHLMDTGVRRFFVVNGHAEVVNFLRSWQRDPASTGTHLHTYDFSTMYTTIPLNDLILVINGLIRETANFEGKYLVGEGSITLSINSNSRRAIWEKSMFSNMKRRFTLFP